VGAPGGAKEEGSFVPGLVWVVQGGSSLHPLRLHVHVCMLFLFYARAWFLVPALCLFSYAYARHARTRVAGLGPVYDYMVVGSFAFH
jgi:hypothetical protein